MKLIPIVALLLVSRAPVAQTLITVDDNGPADFSSLTTAIAGAPDGATILVRAGGYNSGDLLIDGRSLVITADAGASVLLQNTTIRIQNLAAGQTVVLRGITCAPQPQTEALRAQDCQGVVWIEDVVVPGTPSPILLGEASVVLRDCASVVLARTSIGGAGAQQSFMTGGPGLRALRSSVHAFECELAGGRGGAHPTSPQVGGPGVLLDDSFLFAASSTIRGGPGGTVGFFLSCVTGTSGTGGTGLVLAGTSSQAHLLGGTLAGGPGGDAPGTCTVGPAGAPSDSAAGTLVSVAWPDHGLSVTSPVSLSGSASASFSGSPGEFAWFLYGESAGTLFLPQVLGTLTLGFPLFLVEAGTLDGAGTLDVALSPALASGAQATTFLLQALFFDSGSGSFTLSSPAAFVTLADGI